MTVRIVPTRSGRASGNHAGGRASADAAAQMRTAPARAWRGPAAQLR